jgi:hypothetical protein
MWYKLFISTIVCVNVLLNIYYQKQIKTNDTNYINL